MPSKIDSPQIIENPTKLKTNYRFIRLLHRLGSERRKYNLSDFLCNLGSCFHGNMEKKSIEKMKEKKSYSLSFGFQLSGVQREEVVRLDNWRRGKTIWWKWARYYLFNPIPSSNKFRSWDTIFVFEYNPTNSYSNSNVELGCRIRYEIGNKQIYRFF